MSATAFAASLGSWWTEAGRDLPWRRTRDPWAVLVAETMLQQTQVTRVIPRWTAFLARFPDPPACAAAAPAEVIAAWAGLGYNRRAVALHEAAVAAVERHGGCIPDDLDALLALPGVGPYTARAILAFAGGRDVGVVDTNAARVLARAVAGVRLGRAGAQRLADGLVPPGGGWPHNQAMLDLGAAFCRPRPHCGTCPVTEACRWASLGHPEPDPADGSAGVSGRQSAFAGSDRQGRGRLVAALRHGPVALVDLAATAGWPDEHDRVARIVAGLVADGLAEVDPNGGLTLPGLSGTVRVPVSHRGLLADEPG